MLRAVEPLEHVPPVPGSLLETRGWQAKEALVCGQDTCNVKMVDIEVEGIAKHNESAGGAGVAGGHGERRVRRSWPKPSTTNPKPESD